jgi:hypothetical protein
MFMQEYMNYFRHSLEEIISVPLDRVGTFTFSDDNAESGAGAEFYQEIKQSDVIECAGTTVLGAANIFPELIEMQKDYIKRIPNSWVTPGVASQQVYTTPDMLKLFGARLQAGDWVTDEELEDMYQQKCYGFYLGSAYKDVPVGTRYVNEDGWTAVILGILADDTVWLSDSLTKGDYAYNTDASIDMNYMILEVSDSIGSSMLFYSVADGYTMEEGREEIQSIGRKYDMSFYGMNSIEDKIQSAESDMDIQKQLFLRLFVLMVIVAVISLSKFQMVSILNQYYEYGVLLVSGAGMSDIGGMVLVETLLKFLAAYFLSAASSTLIIVRIFTNTYGAKISMIRNVLLYYASWRVLLIGLLVMLLATIIPIIKLLCTKPVELLGGFRE